MGFSEKLERLMRIFPGVAGYQDKESARATDKAIRLRLAAEIELMKRNLEEDKRALTEKKDLSMLPALDRLSSKLDKLVNLTQYAAGGYRGLFDPNPVTQKTLDRLYTFDLSLFEKLESAWNHVKQIGLLHSDPAGMAEGIDRLNRFLDDFEKTLSKRRKIFNAE